MKKDKLNNLKLNKIRNYKIKCNKSKNFNKENVSKKILLYRNIKKHCFEPFEKLKDKIENYINNNDTEYKNELNEFKKYIIQPNLLLLKVLFNGFMEDKKRNMEDENRNHVFFKKINDTIEKIDKILFYKQIFVNKIISKDFKVSLINLKTHYNNFIDRFLIDDIKNIDIYIKEISIVTEDLKDLNISGPNSHKISLYCPIRKEHVKENTHGLSYGKFVDSIYFKVDSGNHLLCPSKENAVYLFFTILFKHEKFISPTQLIILKNFEKLGASTLPNQIANLYQFQGKDRFEAQIDYPNVFNDIQKYLIKENISIQASNFVEGTLLLTYLEDSVNDESLIQKIDLESFSAHIIISFLLKMNDGKGDNYIIEKNTNIIVGFDNDGSLNADQIRKGKIIFPKNDSLGENAKVKDESIWYIDIKNILYTLPLMDNDIHANIIETIKNINIEIFIFEWLYHFIQKEILIKKMILKSKDKLNSSEDDILKQFENLFKFSLDNKDNFEATLSLPTVLPNGWFKRFKETFIFIQNEFRTLEPGKSITHRQLFQKVLPFLSIYYASLQEITRSYNVNKTAFKNYPINSPYNYQIYFLYDTKNETQFKQICNSAKDQNEANFLGILNSHNYQSIEELYQDIEKKNFTKRIDNNSLSNYIPEDYELITNVFKNHLSSIQYKKENFKSKFSNYKNEYSQVESFLQFFIDVINNENNEILRLSIQDIDESWRTNIYSILLKLIKNGANGKLLDNIIKTFKIDLNCYSSETKSTFHKSINACNTNEVKTEQFEVLKNNGANIYVLNKQLNPIELSIEKNNFELFLWFIKNGYCQKLNMYRFKEYYCLNLRNCEKDEMKIYINSIYHSNPLLLWKLSLSELLPEQIYKTPNTEEKIVVTFKKKRILNKKFVKELFDENNKPIIKTSSGIPFIERFGLRIYFKFLPSSPGNEIAVKNLTERFLGYCTPYSKIALIDQYPVLLMQYVPGKPILHHILKEPFIGNFKRGESFICNEFEKDYQLKNPFDMSTIDKFNISQQILCSVLLNNWDGNLGNFIISKDPNIGLNKIISINNEKSLNLPIKRNAIGKNKIIEIENILLLSNLMFEEVDKQLIELFNSKQIKKEIEKWLEYLERKNEKIKKLFGSINKMDQTIIGIPIEKKLVKIIIAKLNGIKEIFSSKEYITNFDILQICEPLLANKYNEYINCEKSTLFEKYINLRELKRLEYEKKILNLNLNEKREHIEPKEAIEEFKKYKTQTKLILKAQNNDLFRCKYSFDQYSIQKILKDFNFKNLSTIQENNLFLAFKSYEKSIVTITIINSKEFDRDKLFHLSNLDKIKKINLYNCPSFLGFWELIPSLIILKVEDCSNFKYAQFKSPNLKHLEIINCPLKTIEIVAPSLQYLNLKDSLSINNALTFIEKIPIFKELMYLDISFSKYTKFDDLVISLILPNLIEFKATNLMGIKILFIYLPKAIKLELDLSEIIHIVGEAPSLENLPIDSKLSEYKKSLINIIGPPSHSSTSRIFNLIDDYINEKSITCNLFINFYNLKELIEYKKKKKNSFINPLYCNSIILVIMELDDFENSIKEINQNLGFLSKKNIKNFEHTKFFLLINGKSNTIDDRVERLKKSIKFVDYLNLNLAKDQCKTLPIYRNTPITNNPSTNILSANDIIECFKLYNEKIYKTN